MKKLILALCLVCFLIACSSTAFAAVALKVGSNRVGTSFYAQGATIADVINKYAPELRVEAMPIAGGIGNLKLLGEDKTLDFALTMNNNNMWAYNGLSVFSEKKYENLRGLVGGLDRYYVGIMAKSDLGADSVEDIIAKKMKIHIMTQAKGSTAELITAQILESCGVTYKDIEGWGGRVSFTDTDAIINSFKDGNCDIFVLNINKGHPVISELSLTGRMKIIPLSENMVKFLADKYGYVPDYLPENSFKYQEKQVRSAGSSTTVTAPEKMSDEIAYAITKAVVEHKEDLVRGHKAFTDFDPALASDKAMMGGIPLHPGAVKYYREVGQIK